MPYSNTAVSHVSRNTFRSECRDIGRRLKGCDDSTAECEDLSVNPVLSWRDSALSGIECLFRVGRECNDGNYLEAWEHTLILLVVLSQDVLDE